MAINDYTDGHSAYTGRRQLLPKGDHNFVVSKFEDVENKKGNGRNIEATYTVVGGDYDGIEVREWLSIVNPNETAQNIARAKLTAITTVLALDPNVAEFEDFVGKTLRLRVGHEQNDYVDRQGNKRTGTNVSVDNYMNTKGEDASGKKVPDFVPEKEAEPQAQSSNQAAQQDTSSADTQPSYDDDEIPF